jgi:hypothetical protein
VIFVVKNLEVPQNYDDKLRGLNKGRRMHRWLGGVDKFEPMSGGGDMDHAEEAFGELIIPGCDGAVDFQAAEEAFDVVSVPVERLVMFDLDPAV